MNGRGPKGGQSAAPILTTSIAIAYSDSDGPLSTARIPTELQCVTSIGLLAYKNDACLYAKSFEEPL